MTDMLVGFDFAQPTLRYIKGFGLINSIHELGNLTLS